MADHTYTRGTENSTANARDAATSAAACHSSGRPARAAAAVGASLVTCSMPSSRAMPNRIDVKPTIASMSRPAPATRFLRASSASAVVSVRPGMSAMTPESTMTSRDAPG